MMFDNEKYTRLLRRQLRKTIGLNLENLNKSRLISFIEMVNDAYLFNINEQNLYRRAEEIAAREYQKLNNQLIEKNAFLDSFNHGLAHDIKNHSSNILGLVNMQKKYIKKGDLEKLNQITDKLEESSKTLTSIVQGFLHLSRVEADLKEERKPIDPANLIKSIEYEIDYIKRAKKATIIYDIQSVVFVESTLRIILVNLISNAIKYSKKDVPPYVIVKLKCDAKNIYLEVIDNGVGMDLKTGNKKVYNLYNNSNATKGYGVGLFLVKKIADKYKGIINIASIVNVGTTISITFPKK